MTNRNPLANHTWKPWIGVQNGKVLYIAASPDLNPLDIAANHGPKPNAGLAPDGHIANHSCGARDKRIGRNLFGKSLKIVSHHSFRNLQALSYQRLTVS
jgi:hypothetical protein